MPDEQQADISRFFTVPEEETLKVRPDDTQALARKFGVENLDEYDDEKRDKIISLVRELDLVQKSIEGAEEQEDAETWLGSSEANDLIAERDELQRELDELTGENKKLSGKGKVPEKTKESLSKMQRIEPRDSSRQIERMRQEHKKSLVEER